MITCLIFLIFIMLVSVFDVVSFCAAVDNDIKCVLISIKLYVLSKRRVLLCRMEK